MAALAQAKALARKAAFARRKAAHGPGDNTGALYALLAESQGRVIAGYMPIRTEIDPLPAMAKLAAQNAICVPVIQGEGQPLLFHRWTPGCAMVPGPFGAQVPQSAQPLNPDLLIVPLVAFTRSAHRLGYGGGFYDRTLAGLPGATAYGFAYAAQETESLPLEPTDLALDAIVTETQVLWPNPVP